MAWPPACLPSTACSWRGRALPQAWWRAGGSRGGWQCHLLPAPTEHTTELPEVAPYRPGELYRRELPPLRTVLHGIAGPCLLVVDAYADLDPSGQPSLAAHVNAESAVPVIGVAKSTFRIATHAILVLRGTAARLVFVTAAGMSRADAQKLVGTWLAGCGYPTSCATPTKLLIIVARTVSFGPGMTA